MEPSETVTEELSTVDLKKKVAELEEHVGSLEELLENAITEREAALEKSNHQLQIISDLESNLELTRLEAAVETENAKSLILTERQLEEKLEATQMEKIVLTHQKQNYADAFNKLQDWYLELKKDALSKEKELEDFRAKNSELELKLADDLEEIELLNQEQSELQAMVDSSTQMLNYRIKESAIQMEKLQEAETLAHKYSSSLNDILSEAKKREISLSDAIQTLKTENSSLQDDNARLKKMVAPRNEKLAMLFDSSQSKTAGDAKSPLSHPSYTLTKSLQSLSLGVLGAELSIIKRILPKKIMDSFAFVTNVILVLQKVFKKSVFLLEYFEEAYFSDLVEDALENALSVSQDRGFIRWLACTSLTLARLIEQISTVFDALRFSSVDQLGACLSDECTLGATLEKAEKAIEKLAKTAENNRFSATVDISSLEEVVESLLEFQSTLPIPEKRKDKLPDVIDGSKVHTDLIRLKCCCTIGICHAPYLPELKDVIDGNVWYKMYIQSNELLKRIWEKIHGFNEFKQILEPSSTGFFSITSRYFQEYNLFSNMIFQVQKVLMNAEEDGNIDANVNTLRTTVKELENISFMSMMEGVDGAGMTMLRQTGFSEIPWKRILDEASASMQDNLNLKDKYDKAEVKFESLLELLNGSSKNLEHAKKEVEEWKNKFSQQRLINDKNAVIKEELSKLRKDKTHFISLINSLKDTLRQKEHYLEVKTAELAELQKEMQEASSQLEKLRNAMLQQIQNDFYVKEISSLRIVVKNLERDLLALHTQNLPLEFKQDFCTHVPPVVYLEDTAKQLGILENTQEIHAGNAPQEGIVFQDDAKHADMYKQLYKLVSELRSVEEQVIEHVSEVPIWDPNLPPAENERSLRSYRNTHDSIRSSMLRIQRKIELHLHFIMEGSHKFQAFGDYGNLAAMRYLKQFADLAEFPGIKPSDSPAAILRVPYNSISNPSQRGDLKGSTKRMLVNEVQLSTLFQLLANNL